MSVVLIGAKEIQDTLNALPQAITHKILQDAHIEAAFPLISAAHLLVPVGKTGHLADSIGPERISVKRGEIGQVNIGPRRRGGYKGFHGHLVEYPKTNRDGTKTHGKPFMAPAFERTKKEVEKNINVSVGRKLVATMKRKLGKAFVR